MAYLLAGDIEAAGAALLQTSLDEPVDWLLVPHHGSKTSSTESLVNTLQPLGGGAYAGYLNRFELRWQRLVQRYQAVGNQAGWIASAAQPHWNSAQPGNWNASASIQAHY